MSMEKFRRQIFYISGFDPRGSSFYYRLYRQEAEKYASLKNIPAAGISERASCPASPHRTDWVIENDSCITDYAFLGWDDIVRSLWKQRRSHIVRDIAATYASYLTRSRLIEAFKIAPATVKAFLYPLAAILAAMVASLVIAGLAGWIWGLGAFPALASFLFFMTRKWQPTWLLHTFSFNRRLCSEESSDIRQRCRSYADAVIKALREDRHDEILLIGHSNGVTLLIETLDLVMESGADTGKLKILSLGQFVQMVTMHRGGGHIRKALERLQTIKTPWLDISAAGDPACFPLIGPFYKTVPDFPPNLTVASPRLHTQYAPDKYKTLRRDKFNFHFLYLKCSDILGAYNYPSITLEAAPLEDHIDKIKTDASRHA
ncbi:MAG: hypothetical protein WC989_09730 [Micavibrio sp.]